MKHVCQGNATQHVANTPVDVGYRPLEHKGEPQPFSADAETEFTQVLGDGNRIERRYSSMVARDNQGRTRREEEIALVGPLTVDGPSPRLVTIVDPVAGQSYTLDDKQRVAYRNPIAMTKLRTAHAMGWAAAGTDGQFAWTSGTAVAKPPLTVTATPGERVFVGDGAATKVTTESLGTKSIEGVMADWCAPPSGAKVTPEGVPTRRKRDRMYRP